MKNLMTVLFAGAMLTTVAFSQGNDNGANQRFHAKTGRDTPQVEAAKAKPAGTSKMMGHECTMSCCKH